MKKNIIEKYLRGLDHAEEANNNCESAMNNNNNQEIDMSADASKKPELSKWLESSVNFTPSNYNVDFIKNDKRKSVKNDVNSSLCEKELLAAETLVLLNNNFRTKFYNS